MRKVHKKSKEEGKQRLKNKRFSHSTSSRKRKGEW
jgi:hypothetical protein